MKKSILLIGLVALLSSCMVTRPTRGEQYAKLYAEKPLSLLVLPPINKTSHVEAKDLLYTSINKPLIDAGYYVVSPHLAMEILKSESAYDAELFVDAPLGIFQKVFGCDAVVFSEVLSWKKEGFCIVTDIRYFIKSVTTGDILFDRSCKLSLDMSVDSGGDNVYSAVFDLVMSTVATAVTDHIVAARKANYFIFRDIPRGPYNPAHMQDSQVVAEFKDVQARVKNVTLN